jgi:uncharacterized protein (DUF885 family)
VIRRTLSLLALNALVLLGSFAAAPFPAADRRFQELARRYIEATWAFSPSWATTMGRHEYDARLEDFSRASIHREITLCESTLKLLRAMPRAKLSEPVRIDYDLLETRIQANLFDLTEVRGWERNPGIYAYGEAIFGLMARTYAPPEVRLRRVIARLGQVPRQFAAARANLKHPPELFTRLAASECGGSVDFLEHEVPGAFAAVKDSALWRDYRAASTRAIEATRAYARWLNDTLLARSDGSFVLGEERYRKKLQYEEMVSLPIDTLLAAGQREMDRLEARYRAAGRRIDPNAPLDSLAERMRRDHPSADSLLPFVRGLLEDIRSACGSLHFIEVPSEVRCRVRPTPSFAADRSFASLDAPGAFETKADEAYFNVTTPDPSWSPGRIEEHLRGYSRWSVPSVSLHEAYPGHYVHFLYGKRAPTFVRKSMGCGSFAEGWAVYCEEGMLDQGYRKGDPRFEFGVMRWALVRACRFQVGIRVHTRGMTMDQAVQYFVDHAGMERANAEREAYRAAFDPTYIIYELGALQIRKLRDDVARTQGAAFDLARFHESMLSQGSLPVALLRRVLLHDDGPTL